MVASRPRIGHVLLLLPLAGVVACLVWRAGSVREDPAEVLRALRAAAGPTLPEPSTCGAASRSEPERYDRETLYTFIDGAAEGYLARGFQRCIVASYTFSDSAGPPLEAVVEVYRFAESLGATSLFEEERPKGATPLPGPAGGVTDGTVLLAVAGRDLLKATVVSGADGRAALEKIAAAWAAGVTP